MSVNKFDKIYNPPIFIDNGKRLELFNIVNTLNTSDLLQYSLINKISLNQCNDNDDNLIHVVIRMDDAKITEMAKLNIIKFLVQNNVYPDKPNKNNNTPLHLACELQYSNIVEYLLKIGVNPNFTDNNGNTAFHYLLTGNIKLADSEVSIKDFIPKNQNRNIKINFTNTFDQIINSNNNNISIMNLSSYQNSNKKFIIFMNDFTNTSLMKSKYNIDINKDIIKLLLNYKANPYINNNNNISPIHNILKNYNYKIFSELKNIGIDFNRFNSDNPTKFIENEIKNNNDKLLDSSSLKKILHNITEAHYNEFKALILNNPRFGNNFLKIFEDSFNITAYLTFYILSELLINTSHAELIASFPSVNIPNTNAIESDPKQTIAFNSSHLFNQVGCDNSGNPITIETSEYYQLQELLKIKLKARPIYKKTCTAKEYNDLKQEIDNITKRMTTIAAPRPININSNYTPEFYIEVWNKYLAKANMNDKFNYNLLPLYILNNRPENIPLLKQLECFCEQYFMNKYTSDYILGIVYRYILTRQTELIVCHSIKTVILNIILNFIMDNEEGVAPAKISFEYSFDYDYFITTILNYLPPVNPNKLYTINSSFTSIVDKLVKNTLNIFDNIDEMNTNKAIEVKDIILSDIVNNLKNILESLDVAQRQLLFKRIDKTTNTITPGLLTTDYDKPINTLINLLENNMVVYFDTIIPKLLTSWASIVENIFKYIINYSRMQETHIQLNF